jgi:hypothetical protein
MQFQFEKETKRREKEFHILLEAIQNSSSNNISKRYSSIQEL